MYDCHEDNDYKKLSQWQIQKMGRLSPDVSSMVIPRSVQRSAVWFAATRMLRTTWMKVYVLVEFSAKLE